MKVSVIGASGYSGGELLRLIANHPEFTLGAAIAHSQVGVAITTVHPQLTGLAGAMSGHFLPFDKDALSDSELIFFALPHGESGRLIGEHVELFLTKKIVDLGADFRLSSKSLWERYYGGVHHGYWQYGLPELPGARNAISSSTRIANPGCYATALALSIAPFAKIKSQVNLTDVVVTAASGTTGAGRNSKTHLLGSEVMNSISAYKIGGVHQHTPEVEAAVEQLTGSPVHLSFTPFLAPMPRGILASVSIPVADTSLNQLRELFMNEYEDERFVHVLAPEQLPQTNALLGSNSVHLQVALDTHVGRAIVIAALDNLGKGAAGQGIQNANLMCGFDESAGLEGAGLR